MSNSATTTPRRTAARRLPPTTSDLEDDGTRPYFLWWTDLTVGDFRARLRSEDPSIRAYWMGALLREANTRDVWLFVTAEEIRHLWPKLLRHLGRSREMWTWLLEMPGTPWPPGDARDDATAPHRADPEDALEALCGSVVRYDDPTEPVD